MLEEKNNEENIVNEEQVVQVEESVASTDEHEGTGEAVNAASPAQEQVKDDSDSIQAKNFKALRQKMAAIERERDELAQQVRKQQVREEVPVVGDDDEDLVIDIAPDDLAEGKHLSKVAKKIKKLEEQLKSYQKNTVTLTAEAKLKNEFPDIETVVSAENIQTLRDMYPEIAETISSNNDLYTKAKAAYTVIRKLGIHSSQDYSAEKQLAQKNMAKPKPLASVSPQQGESPIARANAFANGLTPELKAQLRKEMEEATKMM